MTLLVCTVAFMLIGTGDRGGKPRHSYPQRRRDLAKEALESSAWQRPGCELRLARGGAKVHEQTRKRRQRDSVIRRAKRTPNRRQCELGRPMDGVEDSTLIFHVPRLISRRGRSISPHSSPASVTQSCADIVGPWSLQRSNL